MQMSLLQIANMNLFHIFTARMLSRLSLPSLQLVHLKLKEGVAITPQLIIVHHNNSCLSRYGCKLHSCALIHEMQHSTHTHTAPDQTCFFFLGHKPVYPCRKLNHPYLADHELMQTEGVQQHIKRPCSWILLCSPTACACV